MYVTRVQTCAQRRRRRREGAGTIRGCNHRWKYTTVRSPRCIGTGEKRPACGGFCFHLPGEYFIRRPRVRPYHPLWECAYRLLGSVSPLYRGATGPHIYIRCCRDDKGRCTTCIREHERNSEKNREKSLTCYTILWHGRDNSCIVSVLYQSDNKEKVRFPDFF